MAERVCAKDTSPDGEFRDNKMRVESRKPKQPVTWIPAVLTLITQKGPITSSELAAVVGKTSGGIALTRCRQVGLPIKAVGIAPGSDRQKLYNLDIAELWLALEECVKQQNRYARLITMQDGCPRPLFSGPTAWIAHLRKLDKRSTHKKASPFVREE